MKKRTPSVIYYANCDDNGTGYTTLEEVRPDDENWDEAIKFLNHPNWPYFSQRSKALAKCKTYLRYQITHLKANLKTL